MLKNLVLLSTLAFAAPVLAQQFSVQGVTGATSFSVSGTQLNITAQSPQDSDALVIDVQQSAGSIYNMLLAANYNGTYVTLEMNVAPNTTSVSVPWTAICSIMNGGNSAGTCQGVNGSITAILYVDEIPNGVLSAGDASIPVNITVSSP